MTVSSVPDVEGDAGSDDATSDYYDSDYPGVGDGPASNWDEAMVKSGVATDVAFYVGLSLASGPDVLEIGAGTGRVTAGLLRAGLNVTAVEPSSAMRRRLERRVASFEPRARIFDDATRAGEARFDSAILALGVLACLPTLDAQLALLRQVRSRLRPGGLLALDVPDAIGLGAPHPSLQPTWVRVHAERRTRYTRVAQRTPVRGDQTIAVVGHYDEQGRPRTPFSLRLRLLFPGELRLALAAAGFSDIELSGDVVPSPVGHGGRLFALAAAGDDARRDASFWEPPPSDLGETALASAAARALHTASTEGSLSDPFAVRLAGARGQACLAEMGGHAIAGAFVARAAWMDERARAGVLGGARSIVSLGAGLCTRSLRLPELAAVETLEIDAEDVLAYKERSMVDFPSPGVRRARLDVRRVDEALALARAARPPRLIVAEGLLSFLEPERARALVRGLVDSLQPGEGLIFDRADARVPTTPALARFLDVRGLHHAPFEVDDLFEGDDSLSARSTHLGAADACVGLPRSALGGSRLYAVTRTR
jgi:methyltransferase (TIGR00027 family)